MRFTSAAVAFKTHPLPFVVGIFLTLSVLVAGGLWLLDERTGESGEELAAPVGGLVEEVPDLDLAKQLDRPLTTSEVEQTLKNEEAAPLEGNSKSAATVSEDAVSDPNTESAEPASPSEVDSPVEASNASTAAAATESEAVEEQGATWTSTVFPGMSVTYPAGWKVIEKEIDSEFTGLSDYEITLAKADVELRVYLYPLRAGGCVDETTRETATGYTTTNGFGEFQVSGENEVPYVLQYDEGIPECVYDTLVQSNLSLTGLTEANASNSSWIMDRFGLAEAQYVVVIEAALPAPDAPLLSEVRQIVSQSVFE